MTRGSWKASERATEAHSPALRVATTRAVASMLDWLKAFESGKDEPPAKVELILHAQALRRALDEHGSNA